MQTLSLLPLFMDLRGKAVVLAGDSDGLVWKVELLAACGAKVRVYSTVKDLLTMIEERAFVGELILIHREPELRDFAGARFAIGAYDDEAPALAFEALAREAKVLVNLVDRPAISDVQFGAIVNRSPIVIAIATDGKAPSLGRAIRNRIEAILPPEIAQWAQYAPTVRAQLPRMSGPKKRAFWANYAQFALAALKNPPHLMDVGAVMRRINEKQNELIVINVGPADRHDLITLEALSYLQRSDIVMCGQGLHPLSIDLARREARIIQLTGSPEQNNVLVRETVTQSPGQCIIWLHTECDTLDLAGWLGSDIKMRYLKAGS
jgi:uroporphyrin-III C-methyltransferase / precorrin-2 dehydrogenase / sirohydrochlorin ferrochelatase